MKSFDKDELIKVLLSFGKYRFLKSTETLTIDSILLTKSIFSNAYDGSERLAPTLVMHTTAGDTVITSAKTNVDFMQEFVNNNQTLPETLTLNFIRVQNDEGKLVWKSPAIVPPVVEASSQLTPTGFTSTPQTTPATAFNYGTPVTPQSYSGLK